jgi:hypothetical protein
MNVPPSEQGYFFAIHGCALQVRLWFPSPSVPKWRIQVEFFIYSYTLHCVDETTDGFLVMARRRLFQPGRPSMSLLLTDSLVGLYI